MATRRLMLLLAPILAFGLVPKTAKAQLQIMPLGDSITWGYNGSTTSPASPGGYRDPLYTDLTGSGYTVNYVGASNENPSTTLTNAGQTAQNGYNGYTTDEITDNLAGDLTSGNPAYNPSNTESNNGGYWLTGGGGTGRGPETANVILLSIGLNDMGLGYDPQYDPTNPFGVTVTGTSPTPDETVAQFDQDLTTRLNTLIVTLQAYEPNATIVVGVTPDAALDFYNYSTYTGEVKTYNTDIANLIASYPTGSNVHYLDLYDDLGGTGETAAYYSALNGSVDDGTHPNSLGYAEIASLWAQAIEADYTAPVPEPNSLGLLALGALVTLLLRRQLQIRR